MTAGTKGGFDSNDPCVGQNEKKLPWEPKQASVSGNALQKRPYLYGGVKMGAGGETVAVGRWRERRGSINDDDKWLSQWCSQWCILEYACLTVPW
jgi:hypothetical protein